MRKAPDIPKPYVPPVMADAPPCPKCGGDQTGYVRDFLRHITDNKPGTWASGYCVACEIQWRYRHGAEPHPEMNMDGDWS